MRYSIHFKKGINEQLEHLATEMRDWEDTPRIDENEKENIKKAICQFNHTIQADPFKIGGVDGSGDFPSVTYADSFVYTTVAHGTIYRSDLISGLKEEEPSFDPIIHFSWFPEEQEKRVRSWDKTFEALTGLQINDVISSSDYLELKSSFNKRTYSISNLHQKLIRPHASDSGNIAIQLRSVGELSAALQLIKNGENVAYALIDGTFSLPTVTRSSDGTLFYEHLKRLCCVAARKKGVGFFALSKSHGLPGIENIEEIVRKKFELEKGGKAEHWFLRLPTYGVESWSLSITDGRLLPPPGAITYLVRFHKNTPIFRLDMDREYWSKYIQSKSKEEMRQKERRIFEHLDYASHDQRCYGYPYPIKAGHDRASLTKGERGTLRKQIIDAAVRAGMKRQLFRNASIATGHE
ncbi:hypothetical protein ACFLYW_00785 [Thermodesulfobacteriota bacterium]